MSFSEKIEVCVAQGNVIHVTYPITCLPSVLPVFDGKGIGIDITHLPGGGRYTFTRNLR